ncbi:metal ABC transporter ATP-binding protein [Haloprofundus sp. MHR1]|uniref:metal ABC transporter ATP-binding protein n=1 Tax=Haloprofundus sp. MHR1 TaxID=2572921 RepID=UPI0010BE7640|nr:metal ABC transporter ATP-binding protein [Haloprofundus sp. MHR1]QCJ46186.1 metal ABC transporter ATP-binding protein [Haloprofundus sp. MHR1]
MTAIELSDVTFGYTDTPVVEDVSLSVEEGEFLGLVGPNGSGKSTLLRLMLGLASPDAGTVELFGESARSFDAGERLGYVAQDVANAATEMPITVREVVEMGRYPHVGFGRLGAEDRRIVADALDTVGVAELADRRLAHLSGGQRQRVFIARALAGEADLLALDEPAVGVDADSREAFYDLLRDLNDDGLTVVLIEHDIGVVTEHATTVACLNRRLFFHGEPSGFAESDALSRAYGANQRMLEHDHSHDHAHDSTHDHSHDSTRLQP